MDAYELRQKAIASNVANIDTPGYKRKEVSFEDQLQKAEATHLKGQDQGIDSVKPQMIQEDQPPQLEDEMMTLADTQMRVQLVTRALRHSFQMIQSSLKSGQQA